MLIKLFGEIRTGRDSSKTDGGWRGEKINLLYVDGRDGEQNQKLCTGTGGTRLVFTMSRDPRGIKNAAPHTSVLNYTRVIGYSDRNGIVNGRISIVFSRIPSVINDPHGSNTDHDITERFNPFY